MARDLRRVVTRRLVLTEPTDADLPGLFALHADPAVWHHLPSARHTEPARTAVQLTRDRDSWDRVGLGSWVVRLRPDRHGNGGCGGGGDGDPPDPGPPVGLAGCRWHAGPAWNLGYRLAPAVQGRGLATEAVAAALAAAAELDASLPVVAALLAHNTASLRTAQRAGLREVWRGPDAGNPDPAAVRVLLADPSPSPAVVAAFVAGS